MISAILTAAGTGTRMRQEIPKQFLHVENKPIIIYTLEVFEKDPNIDSIIVVTLKPWIEMLNTYARQYNITKLVSIVPGGKSGQDSIREGVNESVRIHGEDVTVLIHDGNRPLVNSEIISNAIATYNEFGSAVTAIPTVEAVFTSDDGIEGNESIPRELLYRTQTPHIYSAKEVIRAHEEARNKGITDTAATCVLMHKLGKKVYFSKGSETNLKITTVDDLLIFKALLNTRKDDYIK